MDLLSKLQLAANVVQKTACGIPGKAGTSVPKAVVVAPKLEIEMSNRTKRVVAHVPGLLPIPEYATSIYVLGALV